MRWRHHGFDCHASIVGCIFWHDQTIASWDRIWYTDVGAHVVWPRVRMERTIPDRNPEPSQIRAGQRSSASQARGLRIPPARVAHALTSGAERLPVYFVVEASAGMGLDRAKAISDGLAVFRDALQVAVRTSLQVDVSVLTFGSSAEQIVPLTSIADFVPPAIDAAGAVALGDGIRCLGDCIEREVSWNESDALALDLKPIAILLLENHPTDDWEPHALDFHRRGSADVLACIAEPTIQGGGYRLLSDHLVSVADFESTRISELFRWLSAVVVRSRSGGTS